MSAFPYCNLLLFFLLQTKVSASLETNGTQPDGDKCCRALVEKISETMDHLFQTNLRLNNTEVYLSQLVNELNKSRQSEVALRDQLEKQLDKQQQLNDVLSKMLENLTNEENGTRENISCAVLGPRDCSDIRAMGFNNSGVYRIFAGGDDKRMQVDVYCDFSSANESWLVFQRRMDGSENFYRNYAQYAQGFGNLSGEFWAGNELLNLVTRNRKYKMRIDLEDFEGQKRYAEYTTFAINSSKDFYRLTAEGYSGDAGNSLKWHTGRQFSTYDVDRDEDGRNCAKDFHGAWWYSGCHVSNLNGLYFNGPHKSYADGIEWWHWHGYQYSLKKTEMKIAAVI